jgi:methylmalonate-semialdehyde dehydrogenase [acylating] (EC 1.2.1.27)
MNAPQSPDKTKVEQVKLLIDGQWVESKTSEWRDIVNPATQEVLARVPFATVEEVDAAVAAGQRAFKTWRDTPIGARMRIMLKLQALIREHTKRIAQVLSAEQGKTLPTPKATFSAAWKWSSMRPPSAPCRWASSPRTSPVAWTPTPCASRSACAPASPRSTSRR